MTSSTPKLLHAGADLLHLVEDLEHALETPLARCESAWSEQIAALLECLGKGLWPRIVTAEENARRQADEFSGPCLPTLDRRLNKLNDEEISLWERCSTLRKFIVEIAHPSASPPANVFGMIHEECVRLAADLRRHEEKKATLILEDLDVDIGAGD